MMPPLLLRIHVLSRDGQGFRLWVPLFLMWLLLLPFALVLLPVLFIVALVADFDPIAAIGTVLRLLGALHGTHVEIDSPSAFFFLHVL